jgi:predicted XRE-type DNA-binding protein
VDEVETGSGNVFADLGLPDAEEHLLKAKLVSRIDAIIRRRKRLIPDPRSLHLRGARPPRRQPRRADQARKSDLSALGNQTKAAELLGLSQPDVSRLLRGHFRDFSLERLLRLLLALDRDIEIVIRRRPRSRTRSRVSVSAA